MRYLVIGAGAIGSVFGGFLAKAGHEVALVGREKLIASVRAHGLCITGIWGDHTIAVRDLFTDVSQLGGERFDVVLICVKSYDTREAARQAISCVRPDSFVISLQNGLGNVETIAEAVGWERMVGGRVIFGVELLEPGHVKVTVYAEEVMIGSPRRLIEPERLERIAADFRAAGIPTLCTDDIEKYIWAKVLYNCSLNPLATILKTHYGYLLEHEETRSIMREIIREIFDVAAASGVALFWKKPEDYVEVLFSTLIPATYQHHPSMLQDLSRGKRTEIDALNGAICSLADETGLAVPVNRTIRNIVRTLETVATG